MRSIRIIAISNAVRDYLIERGEVRNPHNVEVILYGYKTHFKRAQIESRMYSQIKHIGTISRLADQKDLPTMFAALKEYQISQPAADLAILGAGPIEVELKNLVSEMNLNSSVSFLGRSSEIYDFLQNLDVFMLTSKYEGFGMVLLEALDAGIPIVASNNSAIPEVLGKDFPGLCNTSDPNDFAKKILSLNEPDYRNMVLRHQETRLKLFDATLMCAKIDSIYSI